MYTFDLCTDTDICTCDKSKWLKALNCQMANLKDVNTLAFGKKSDGTIASVRVVFTLLPTQLISVSIRQ